MFARAFVCALVVWYARAFNSFPRAVQAKSSGLRLARVHRGCQQVPRSLRCEATAFNHQPESTVHQLMPAAKSVGGMLRRLLPLVKKSDEQITTISTRKLTWDLYGRVPHDDWLFTTSRLVEPNLLRRSFVEVVIVTCYFLYSLCFLIPLPSADQSGERYRSSQSTSV